MADSKANGPGFVLAALSAASFGLSGSLGASLLDAGWTPVAVVAARIVLAAIALTGPAIWQLRGRWGLLRRGIGMMTVYGLVAVAGCQLCYFNAIAHLTVGVALLLEYTGTVMVVAWLWIRHGQTPRHLTVAGGGTAVVGLLLVLDLTGAHGISLIGVAWGLGAAVGLAVFFVLSAADEQPLPPLVVAWGGMVVGGGALVVLGATGLLPMRTATTDVRLLDHRVSWLVPVLGLAIIAAAFAYVVGIAAARRLGSKLASFVGLTEVLFAVVFAWLFLGQVPAAEQVGGGAFILAGIALVRADGLRRTDEPERRASTSVSQQVDERPLLR